MHGDRAPDLFPSHQDAPRQANAYEAVFEFFASLPPSAAVSGSYFWLWRTDTTAGGTMDSDFTPHGKPAEVVLRRWYGADTASMCSDHGGYGAAFLAPGDAKSAGFAKGLRQHVELSQDGADASCDGSAAVAAAVAQTAAESARLPSSSRLQYAPVTVPRAYAQHALAPHSRTNRTFNGFVFGGPDEWSSPSYRLDSAGAEASLAALIATGADSVEIIVQVRRGSGKCSGKLPEARCNHVPAHVHPQWYFTNITNTSMYPVTDPTNALATSTDSELAVRTGV